MPQANTIVRRMRNTPMKLDPKRREGEVSPDALQSLLFAGTPPAFLTPVPLPAPTPLKVWRVK